MNWFVALLIIVWLYVLYVMKRANMGVWHYIFGSVGFFIFTIITLEPVLQEFLQKAVSVVSGMLGNVTGMYESYFDQGILFIQSGKDSLSMYIDFECSGVIEILAFVALLLFFEVYDRFEKIIVGIIGVFSIFAANVLRIFLIASMIKVMGSDYYFIAHTIVGRIFFYGCMVILYFYVFTKTQIIRQRVGGFRYERD